MSIDELLDTIAKGDELKAAERLDDALVRLAPLFNLMSNEQLSTSFRYASASPQQ